MNVVKEETLLTSGAYTARVRAFQSSAAFFASVAVEGPGITPPLGVFIVHGHTPEAAVENANLTAASVLTALNRAYEAGRAS